MKALLSLVMTVFIALAGPAVMAEEIPATDASTSSLTTNIIGTQEAPAVLNVVPWKDKEVVLEKKDPSTRLLDQVLEPVDQDVLLREIEYFRSMSTSQQKTP